MYGIHICHKSQPNVGKYTIHGWHGFWNETWICHIAKHLSIYTYTFGWNLKNHQKIERENQFEQVYQKNSSSSMGIRIFSYQINIHFITHSKDKTPSFWPWKFPLKSPKKNGHFQAPQKNTAVSTPCWIQTLPIYPVHRIRGNLEILGHFETDPRIFRTQQIWSSWSTLSKSSWWVSFCQPDGILELWETLGPIAKKVSGAENAGIPSLFLGA